MSRITVAGSMWDRAPRVDPDGYPGPVPPFGYRFGGSWLEAVPASDHGAELDLHEVAILAHGSNACPGQLRRKLGEVVDPPLAVLPVEVTGLLVTFAAVQASYGSVPATVVPAARTASSHVLLLSSAQAAKIDATEGSYVRLPLDADVHEVRLQAGARPLLRCDTYLAEAGPLLDAEGEPVPLEAVDQPTARRLLLETHSP